MFSFAPRLSTRSTLRCSRDRTRPLEAPISAVSQRRQISRAICSWDCTSRIKENTMGSILSRRSLLQSSGLALGAHLLAQYAKAESEEDAGLLRLNLNENQFGPSPTVPAAINREVSRIFRYADTRAAQALSEQIAAYEHVPAGQIVLGEILRALGLYLGSRGGPGGEFIYSTPGYLALVDAASHVGGVGVGVPLDDSFTNDLPALAAKVNSKTRALYLINPHNPTGTVSEDAAFKRFLREVSQHA